MASSSFEEKFSANAVQKAPSTALYFPDFLTKEEADSLWHQVYAAPKPKWTQLSARRLQQWGGIPQEKGMVVEKLPAWLQRTMDRVAALGLFADVSPNHVLVNEYTSGQGIMAHTDGPLYYPVVCTLNLGSHTLLDFTKRRAEGDDDAVDVSATSASSGNEKADSEGFSLLLEPRSLSVVAADLYTDYMHGIAERCDDTLSETCIANLAMCTATLASTGGASNATGGDGDHTLHRDTRVSLTIRHVFKTIKLPAGLRLGR